MRHGIIQRGDLFVVQRQFVSSFSLIKSKIIATTYLLVGGKSISDLDHFKIMLKYGLFDFVCAKNQLKRNLADSKCVDKATACLLEDPYINADVLLGEQLLSIYEMQPESVSIAVLHP